jgi:hypothetical protein
MVSFMPRPLYPRRKSPRYPLDRRVGGPRAVLDDVEKRKFSNLRRLELPPLGRPARSQSLYRLRYPGPYYYITKRIIIQEHRLFITNLLCSRSHNNTKNKDACQHLHYEDSRKQIERIDYIGFPIKRAHRSKQ